MAEYDVGINRNRFSGYTLDGFNKCIFFNPISIYKKKLIELLRVMQHKRLVAEHIEQFFQHMYLCAGKRALKAPRVGTKRVVVFVAPCLVGQVQCFKVGAIVDDDMGSFCGELGHLSGEILTVERPIQLNAVTNVW